MKKLTEYKALVEFLLKNNEFKILDDKVFCKICAKLYEYIPREGVNPLVAHCKTNLHRKRIQDKKLQSNLTLNIVKAKKITNLIRSFW